MLFGAQDISRFIVVCGYTDLRKGIQGLSQLVEGQFNMNPFEEKVLFLFCGKRLTASKLFHGKAMFFAALQALGKGFPLLAADTLRSG